MNANRYLESMNWKGQRGVALILVMLAMLVLSVLAASIVFTARSETFASYNYKLDTQADYLAKAGIQRAINWLRSNRYQPASPTQAALYYQVSQIDPANNPNLYTADTSPVKCKAAGSTCAAAGQIVQLIGFGTGLAGSSSNNYPIGFLNAGGWTVGAAFTADLNDSTFTANRISGDAANSGYYMVNATLLNYRTVNVNPPPAITPTYCTTATFVTCPMETWLITARAVWTGPSGSTATMATAEETATVQPIYSATQGQALYGFCSISMSGSAGVCTDAYNSYYGSYGDGTNKSASGACGALTGNVIDSGAGIGSNGGVSLSSNVSIGGDVTIGTGPSAGCAATPGCPSCNSSTVTGKVINGPHVDPPAVPKFPGGFPGSAPNVTVKNSTGNVTFPAEFNWSSLNKAGSYPSGWPFPLTAGGNPAWPTSTTACMTGLTCNGTKANPYLMGTLTMANSKELDLLGGPDSAHPVYYDIDQINANGSTIVVSGYVVINVQTALDFEGNGIANSVTSGAEVPPLGVQINYAGTSAATLGGNGALCAVVVAPLADVTFKGGGSGGYMIGSVEANNIVDKGGYPVHYDISLSNAGGVLGSMITTAYSRRKM